MQPDQTGHIAQPRVSVCGLPRDVHAHRRHRKTRLDRRLAAIVVADVVAYSHHMHFDEEGTHARYKAHRREVIDPCIATHKGRIVKSTGDGFLAEFPSAVEAARCMIEVQTALATRNLDLPSEQRIQFRIGINLGDIIIEHEDIFGDGVNIAARLEAIAEPGGICISGKVYDEISEKLDVVCEDMGSQQLKNIARPVRVYRVDLGNVRPASTFVATPSPALPNRPSIAVLPFSNMSGDPEQDYFADGMVEEIITALSRFSNLFVIARNSSFTYKGRDVDAKQVGHELGVRYLLEGSVRRAGNRLRLTGQLIDATKGVHLWADRFEGALTDIFILQDQMTTSVIGAIIPKMSQAEFERAKHKPTEHLDAYDYYMRGLARAYCDTEDATSDAQQHFLKAIDLDPDYALAHASAAMCFEARMRNGWMSDRLAEIQEAKRLARRATELGRDDAPALASAGFVIATVASDFDDGAAFIDRALALNVNLARAWQYSGWLRTWMGEPELAIEHATRAMRLSPVDPWLCSIHSAIGFAHFFMGRHEEASSWAAVALRDRPHFQPALRLSAASNALAGRIEKANDAIARLRALNPGLRLSNLGAGPIKRCPELSSRYKEGMRKAGLPE